MPAAFYNLPVYIALLLLFIACNSISVFGFWFHKRYLLRVDNKDIVTKIVWQTVLFFSTVFITFWIVTNWSNLGALKQTTIKESNAIVQLYNDLDSFPKEPRNILEGKLSNYLNLVIDAEYSSLAKGKYNQKVTDCYRDLVLSIYSYEPSGNLSSELRYNRILAHLSELSDYRENRLSYVSGNLTGPLLFFFITMIVVGCFWTGFIDTRSFKFTLFIIMSQNWIISSSTWLILEMDKPFQGEFSVTNAPFISAQKEIKLLKSYDYEKNQASIVTVNQ